MTRHLVCLKIPRPWSYGNSSDYSVKIDACSLIIVLKFVQDYYKILILIEVNLLIGAKSHADLITSCSVNTKWRKRIQSQYRWRMDTGGNYYL